MSELKKYSTVITVDDNTIKGDFGSAILEFSSANDYKNDINVLGIPYHFIEHGSVTPLQKSIGLGSESLKKYIKQIQKK
ncbi:transketolase C-terminal domain-containing protein [Mariniflexile sp.]|uniref:transketolase C-terminal domain-containing protein n=1 Tax=Mariniflexile sp. TaxID=1979402 RepID=UPI003563CF82